NGNHSSTFSGNTTWGQGEYGSGLVFDGDDDVVQITESASTDLGAVIDSYTISAWIKTNQTVTTTASIIAKNDGAGAYPYSLHINSSQQACFQISDGTNSPQTCSTVTVNNNQWRYITGVRDVLQDRIYIYIDGILQNSTTDTTTATAVNNDNLSIGNSGTSYTANDFAGSIDDIKIYNYARTQKQIIEDMNAGHPLVGTPVTGAVAYYKFDEAALNTCPGGTNDFCDSSSNGNDFAFSGAIGGYTTEGRISSAFSGTGSVWASRSDDNDFDFEANEDFSISAWVRSNSATNPSANQFIFTKQQATNNPGYRLFFNTIGQIVCDLDDDTTSYPEDSATTTTDFYDAQWHHVVCIRDIASGRLYLYVDGRLEAEDTSLSATGSIANSTTIYIADDNGTAANSFTGRIDELKIYRAALTYSDILIDINQGKSVVMGSTSTESDGQTASNAKLREYCVPGDTSTCTPPVIHVKFDENRGTNVFDTSGNGQTGNLNHANLFWDIGKTGSAVNLSRSGNAQTRYVTFPDNDILDFGTSTNFTISVWVKRVSNLPETDLADFYQIVSKGLDNDNNPGYRLLQYGTQELAMYISQDQATNYYEEFTSTDPFTNNLWYHILATVDRSSEQNYKIFINGIEQQTNFLGSLSSVGNIDNALDLRIGYMRDNDVLTPVSSPFVVDDVKIYNYIRNNAQIAWDFNRGAPIARYKMDECQGTLVYDASVNANAEAGGKNGTWSGSSGTNTSAGTCGTVNTATVRYNGRNGKFGSSLDFDGTDDTVTVTNTSAIDLNEGLVNGLTISAWVYPRSDGEGDAGRIFDKGSNNYCRLANETSGQAEVRCRLNLATNAEFTAPETIPLNQWSHIAFSWTNDSDDEITIWINGTPYTSNALYSGDPSTDTSNFFIGNNSSGANTFDGQIDDVRIYPYELTQILIRNLINESSSVRFGPVIGTP
ncbi:MAG: LamG domain-containing protein, partial [Patescibacteria group bacterium]|nr:LamG domain-containing protein [Patescibacteria group bacterium]